MQKTLMRMFAKSIIPLAGLAVALSGGAASAEPVKLRLAYLLTETMLPIMAAQKAGEYAKAGIELELTEVQGGPAVVAALASGTADIGYSAPIPPINARLNGVKIKMVAALAHEAEPGRKTVWLIASKASGITGLEAVKGKKISFNANGGLCELAWRDHLLKANVKFEETEPVVLPFPQQEAALEQGGIDAACTVDPFYAAIRNNAAIGSVLLAEGMMADLKEPVISDVVFAGDDYVAGNRELISKFIAVTDQARKDIAADPEKARAAAVEFLGLTPQAAADVHYDTAAETMAITTADVQKLLDSMHKTGMLADPVKADDMVESLAN